MKKNNNPPMDAAGLRRRAAEKLKNRQGSQRSEKGVPRAAEDMQALVHELQIHQIELEMQNEELRQTRAEVETLLSQYTDLYDFAPVGYFTLGCDGAIRRVNLTGEQLLGEERARLLKRRFGLFVSEADRPAFSDFLKKVFTIQAGESDKTACEVTLRNKEDRPPSPEISGSRYFGGARLRHVHIDAAATGDGQECRAVVADITQRKQAEAALQEIHATLERNLKGAINVISETIERKGPYPPGHHRRVASLASAIAREMGLTDFQMQGIELAAAVYDIGLMDIPVEFLQDTNHLEGIKRDLFQGYPQTGHDTLKKIEFPWPIVEIILQHRECFDGSGFPHGLKGADILIEARILAVADAIE
ncbi:MAG: HD domain-containing protein, partial [Deltaproteobacteria bacterium]|nr:HD domain-containing protein [Deltaproteobacteria bacterium]